MSPMYPPLPFSATNLVVSFGIRNLQGVGPTDAALCGASIIRHDAVDVFNARGLAHLPVDTRGIVCFHVGYINPEIANLTIKVGLHLRDELGL